MKNNTLVAVAVVSATLLAGLSGCVPAPKKNYTPAELSDLGSLEELMRTNAKTADPLFSIRDEASYTDAQFAQMADAAPILEASGERTAKFEGEGKFDQGFGDFARVIRDQAKALGEAASAKDAAAAGAALTTMKTACANCHSEYR